jgi:hypothetical protein
VAARVLADVGDVARFADRNRFASWTGTAPIEASSGQMVRHRLSRAGNRKANHVIHIAAACQIRLDTPGRAYYRRKLAAGKSRSRRCAASSDVSPTPSIDQLIADAPSRRTHSCKRGSGRAPRGVTSIQRGRLEPAHRRFGSATSRTRETDATRAVDRPEETHPEAPATGPFDTEGSRCDAPLGGAGGEPMCVPLSRPPGSISATGRPSARVGWWYTERTC